MRMLSLLFQPGVIMTGLIGTLLQVGLGFANSYNVAGAADTIAAYGLGGQLASGGLVAGLTGLFYAMTVASGRAVATGAGAAAGGISGALGTGLNQAFGLTPVADGASQIISFAPIGAALAGLFGMADPAQPPVGFDQMVDAAGLTNVFASTAIGGGMGAFIGRMLMGSGRAAKHAH
jgi:hypothetical protein